jgi:hypothetical protein
MGRGRGSVLQAQLDSRGGEELAKGDARWALSQRGEERDAGGGGGFRRVVAWCGYGGGARPVNGPYHGGHRWHTSRVEK